ncbi:MAG: DUF3140 domain-containing protein [Caldilineaceae bacterium]
MADNQHKNETYREFHDLVNMAPAELEKWLKTDASKSVGQKKEDSDESIGHESGRRIVEIKRKRKAELNEQDYDRMQRVISYIKRHTAQRPGGVNAHLTEQMRNEIAETNWRYSLMNWGYDPLKEE